MSFFDTVKNNLTQGGVDVKLRAPANASMGDASIPVTVTLSSKHDNQTVKGVSVELIRETQNQAFNMDANDTTPQSSSAVVGRAEDTTAFSLNSGQSQDVTVSIIMNSGAAIAEQLPNDSGIAQVAGIMQKLQTVSNAMNRNSYTYYLQASANVEGVAFDPSDRQPIQLLSPGQVGVAINIGG